MKDFTDITFILDRSGSMATIARDVVGGYGQFVKDQKTAGENAAMTLVQFDTEYQTVFSGVPILNVSDKLKFEPRGGTALLDALGRTINETGARLRALPKSERPDKVIFVIFTDGEENSSREFKYEAIKALVERQQNTYNWTFLFLGANIDAFAVGSLLGINQQTTTNYAYDSKGMMSGMRAVSSYTSAVRSHGVCGQSMSSLYQEAENEVKAEDNDTK